MSIVFGIVIIVICFTIIIVQIIKKMCNHKWKIRHQEYTQDAFNNHYKLITSECMKCGKVKIKKYNIN